MQLHDAYFEYYGTVLLQFCLEISFFSLIYKLLALLLQFVCLKFWGPQSQMGFFFFNLPKAENSKFTVVNIFKPFICTAHP